MTKKKDLDAALKRRTTRAAALKHSTTRAAPVLPTHQAQSWRSLGVTPMVTAISNAIRRIPRGCVSTYGAIAKAAGYPRCSRHVARVLKQVDGLPWQRVLGSGGRISLRGELGLEQRFLLESEGVRFRGRRVDMKTFEHRFRRGGTKVPVQTTKQRLPRK